MGKRREKALLSPEISSLPLVCPWSKLLFPGQQDWQGGEGLGGICDTSYLLGLARIGRMTEQSCMRPKFPFEAS